MGKLILTAAVALVLLAAGCTAPPQNYPHEYSPLQVCRNLCPPGQTQNPYPDCTCTGGAAGSGGGGVAATPGPGGAIVVPPIPSGGLALPTHEEGMLILTLTAHNTAQLQGNTAWLTFGEISAYRAGPGAGWTIISTTWKSFDLARIEGRTVMLTRGRVAATKHDRLMLVLDSATLVRNGTALNATAASPMVFVVPMPVTSGGTTLVSLDIDVGRSFTFFENGTVLFEPSIDIGSFRNVHYLVKDDGTVDVERGETIVIERVTAYLNGTHTYDFLGGGAASCLENCTASCVPATIWDCRLACVDACTEETMLPAPQCPDGTPNFQCSATLPWFCENGRFRANCRACGCPENQECLGDGTCAPSGAYAGGECFVQGCTAHPPNACYDGRIVSDCGACGCPSGLECDTTTGECRTPSTPTPEPIPTPTPSYSPI